MAKMYNYKLRTNSDTHVAAYLVSGSSDGLREGKERQGQVHEAILE